MSDSPTRRHGTDYDTLRGLSADAGRSSPRVADDPLAELARLVSQGESSRSSFGTAGEPRVNFGQPAPRAHEAAEPIPEPRIPELRAPEPRAPFVPPAPERIPDRLEPSLFGGDPRPYGAPVQPDYDPAHDDFFADSPPPLRGSQGGYGGYHDEEADSEFAGAFQARGDFHDDFNDTADAGIYPAEDEDEHGDLPVRRRTGLVVGGAVGALLVAGIGAWAYTSVGGGDVEGAPPVIEAKNEEPVKVVPEDKPAADQNKQFYDRIDPNASATVVGPEEPREKPARVILPGAPGDNPSETASAGAPPPGDAPADPAVAAADMSGGEAANGARYVRTIPIRPDGSPAPQDQGPQTAALGEPQPAELPSVIEGTGAGEGMSMQRGSEFGILSSEPAPSAAEPATGSVPMPTPRPDIAAPVAPTHAAPESTATADPAPRGGVNGPPSSPQPQVTVTNDRPLRPQGAPPPAVRAPARQSSTPRAPAPAPAAPRQVAVASAAPTSLPAPRMATATATRGTAGAFSVQLASLPSEAEARSTFTALQRRYPQYLGNLSLSLQQVTLPAGTFYRVKVAQPTQEAASSLCISIKNAGGQCLVQRN